MLYNPKTLIEAFLPLIGWRTGPNADAPQIKEVNTSTSYRWFQSFHPLLNLDSVFSVAPDFDIITNHNTPIFEVSKTYAKDDLVYNTTNFYRSLQDNNTSNLLTDTNFWQETNLHSDWLRQKTIDGILWTINQWLAMKSLRGTSRNLLEDADTLFKTSGSIADTRQKQNKRVGLTILIARSRSITAQLKEIGFWFTEAADIEIKLYKSDKNAPVYTETFNYTGSGQEWFTPSFDWDLLPEGMYFLGYDESALPTTCQAINGLSDYNFSSEGFYHRGTHLWYYPSGKYFSIASFATDQDFTTLWDIRKNTHTLSTNYGLNIKMHVQCDYTDFLVKNAALFTEAIGLGVACYFLTELAINSNVQISRHQRNAEQKASMIIYERDGEKGDKGVNSKFYKMLEMLSFDTSTIDAVCLPCRKNGVYNGTFE